VNLFPRKKRFERVYRERKARGIDAALGQTIEGTHCAYCERFDQHVPNPKCERIAVDVKTISYSMVYPGLCVVNEFDPAEPGGLFIHILKLFAFLCGEPEPGRQEIERFNQSVLKKERQLEKKLGWRGLFSRLRKKRTDQEH
jgi:hypothetical protein